MKTGIRVWAFGLAVLLAAAAAQAQPWERGERRQRGAEERREPPMQFMPPREFRRDDNPPPGPGRMSPEERRQLRRDIQDAGQDIYRREPPHRRF